MADETISTTENETEVPGRRPGEAAAFLVTIILLVAIALLGVALWRAIDDDFPLGGTPAAAGDATTTAAPPADRLVATVNGMEIRESEFQATVAGLPPQMQAALGTRAGRETLTEELIKMKLLEGYARQKGLHRRPEVASRLAAAQGQILTNAALRDLLEAQEEMTPRELYDKYSARFETVRLSQIVIPYEGSVAAGEGEAPSKLEAHSRAARIVGELHGGADFAALARRHSVDQQSAPQGGDIGQVGHGTFPEEVDAQIFALPVGGISEPIETAYGVHLFKVTEKKVRSFEEVEQALERNGRQIQMEIAIDEIRKDADVELNEEFFAQQ